MSKQVIQHKACSQLPTSEDVVLQWVTYWSLLGLLTASDVIGKRNINPTATHETFSVEVFVSVSSFGRLWQNVFAAAILEHFSIGSCCVATTTANTGHKNNCVLYEASSFCKNLDMNRIDVFI